MRGKDLEIVAGITKGFTQKSQARKGRKEKE